MRIMIWGVLLAVVAVVAANLLGRNDGLVTVYWGGWRADLSLNLVLVALVAAIVLLHATLQALSGLLTLPARAGQWRALRRERAAHQALREAQAEYFAGRYGRARKAAEKALQLQRETPQVEADADFRLLALLLAAGSLHRLQDRARRDDLMRRVLDEAERSAPGRAPPVVVRTLAEGARLLRAEWALDDRDPPGALQALAALAPGAARRTQALRLKLMAAQQDRQPLEALQTARLLANHQAFSAGVARSLLRSLASEVLDDAHDLQQLRRLWGQLDAADRRDALVAARAARRAVMLGAPEDARQWLRPFWDQLGELPRDERDAVAMGLLGARSGIGADWLPRLEAASQAFGHEPAVVAAVGAAFAERQLWGKARPLLEQAAAAATLPGRVRRAAWRELAAMARDDGDEARALQCEQSAAAVD
jgi:HemY protein